MEYDFIHFTSCGLIYDAVGVLLLGFAFFFKTKEGIIQEAGTYWDSNPHVLKSIISSKFDGMIGTLMLFIGFIFQALGYANYSHVSAILVSYIALIVLCFFYFIYYRPKHINTWHSALLAKTGEDG